MSAGQPVIYTFSFSHHGQYSSYHRLAHYLRATSDVMDVSLRLPGWLPDRAAHAIHRRWFRWQERRLARRLSAGLPRCVHYLYPENSLFHGSDSKGAHKLVLSCHQPAQFLNQMAAQHPEHHFLRGMRQADCLVLLSHTSVAAYQALAPGVRIEVIPHGVDTEFFQPDPTVKKRPLVITVGNWLRDYACWLEVVKHTMALRPETEFAVVASPNTLTDVRRLLGTTNASVHFYSGLSDLQLRDLYREASVAFVPLQDAEANNAVLETMAMGLPLVVTDLPATREYAGPDASYFRNDDPAAIAHMLADWLVAGERREAIGIAMRQRALTEFSWIRIAARCQELYGELMSGN